ncbi:mucin-12-like isoform X2 [Acanthaster planci]|uniref:Mucin-12-like isoform X2 n=1 Tax=Acanthaster planci TaxID=133434 RepID=A0A8B7YV12_ACAPL|nr:mucin-12-like isoform X2 [Acanthaster planci]
MVLADMANLPEHDFAPTWLKIPSQQQSSKPPNVIYNHGVRSGPSEEHHDRYKSRPYSTDSHHGYGRSPTHDQFGFRGRDEHRHYSGASHRHHSVDDLPWDPDPTTHWNVSLFNGNSSSSYGTGYPRRGSSVPRNGQQYSSNGRYEGSGFASSRGHYQQGKPAGPGRQRYNSGPKSGYSERDDHTNDTPTKEEVQGDGPHDAGKESNKSALSNQDFPSLSGSSDDVETSGTSKTGIPSGAWEKPPGTTRVISGRKMQLIKKSIPSTLDSKSTTRPITLSSSSVVDTPAGSKVGGQNGSATQTSKVLASSNGSSSVVLKSMTSVTPMASSRNKESAIRSAPVPPSRISPIPSKPSPVPILGRSMPMDITPPPVHKVSNNKITSSKGPTDKAPISKSPITKAVTPLATRPSLVDETSSRYQDPPPLQPDTNKGATLADVSLPHKTSAYTTATPVIEDCIKTDQPAPSTPACVISTPATPTTSKSSVTKISATVSSFKTPVSKLSTQTPSKPMSVTNMSSSLTPSKPSSIANMSSNLSKPSSPVSLLALTPNRPTSTGGRSAPVFGRPSVSSSRPSGTIVNRVITASSSTSSSVPVTLHSASNRKEKTITPGHRSTLTPLSKEPPPSLPTFVLPTAPSFDMPAPSPTTPKLKKGDKLDFLNELRRSSNGDISKEVSETNRDNLRETEEKVQMNGSTAEPMTILNREQLDIKTNGIDIHEDVTETENSCEEDSIPNFYPVFSPVKDGPDMSSSLEAEKRLLQEMGWHEHSDNEEGYAPLTEDELKEFQKRSQQLKKNGLTRALPAAFNSVSLPIGSIAQVRLDDGFTSSDSDSSDDES